MNTRGLALSCTILLCFLAVAGTAALQNTQSSSSTQTSPTGEQKASSGEKTVTGCVVREGKAFVLKSDEGTYEFNSARDLSPYEGKKVRISGRWKATGVTTTAPIEATRAAAATEQAPSEQKAAPKKSFVGDLHLYITGEVIGDCAQSK
jgi:hypothetical protein